MHQHSAMALHMTDQNTTSCRVAFCQAKQQQILPCYPPAHSRSEEQLDPVVIWHCILESTRETLWIVMQCRWTEAEGLLYNIECTLVWYIHAVLQAM